MRTKEEGVAPRPEARDKSYVASLQKGLDVLTCFGRQHSRLTVSDVARLMGGSAASARRSLLTLRALGYIDSDGKRFWLSPKVLLVAHAYLSSRPMPSMAQPLLDALSERTRESASLGTLQGDDAIMIARSTARRSLSIGLGIGSRLPAYCSSLGRVLLASLPPPEAARRIRAMARDALTSRTVFAANEVIGLIQRCREEGHACNDGELELGVRSMAVPVLDRTGATVAAMSIAVRAERMALGEFRDAFLPVLRKAAVTLTSRLYPE